MNRLEAMEVFLSVIETGSFSGASRKLGMPLPTVSRKIADLEKHLKVKLLHRTTRLLTLTDSGQAYLNACKRILEDLNEAERAAAGEYASPKGALLITAPIVFGRVHVLPVVTAFLAAYPDVDIRLILGDRNLSLLEEHIDLAVRIGSLPDSNMVSLGVGEIRRVVCASPAYIAKHGVPVSPADLSAHTCITFEVPASTPWRFQTGGKEEYISVRSRLTVNTAEAAIDAAIAGLGITQVLSYQAEAARAAGSLVLLLEEFEPAPMPVSLLYTGGGRIPLKLRAFLDFAVPALRTAMTGQSKLKTKQASVKKTSKKKDVGTA